jgi:hypothetical protein
MKLCWTLVATLLACESKNDADEMASDQAEVCALLGEIVCVGACTCDCELDWSGSPVVFTDESDCQTALVESCDGSSASAAQFSTCSRDLVDTLVDISSCEMPLELPDSCTLVFEK